MLRVVFLRNLNDRHILGALQYLDGVSYRQTFGVNDLVFFGCDDDLATGLRLEPSYKGCRQSCPRSWVFQCRENINDPTSSHWPFGQLDATAKLDSSFRKSFSERCSTVFEYVNRE